MSTSTIVVLIVIVIGLTTVPLITRGLHILFRDYMEYEYHKEDKQNKVEVGKAEDKLKEITNSGSLGDLIEAAKELGDKK